MTKYLKTIFSIGNIITGTVLTTVLTSVIAYAITFNSFTSGDVISSDEVNSNFTMIKDTLDREIIALSVQGVNSPSLTTGSSIPFSTSSSVTIQYGTFNGTTFVCNTAGYYNVKGTIHASPMTILNITGILFTGVETVFFKNSPSGSSDVFIDFDAIVYCNVNDQIYIKGEDSGPFDVYATSALIISKITI